MIKIKKFRNRKLYTNGRYITLKEFAELVIEGNKVVVRDYNENNITSTTIKKAFARGDLTYAELGKALNEE